jgi:hypothetical protein
VALKGKEHSDAFSAWKRGFELLAHDHNLPDLRKKEENKRKTPLALYAAVGGYCIAVPPDARHTPGARSLMIPSCLTDATVPIFARCRQRLLRR